MGKAEEFEYFSVIEDLFINISCKVEVAWFKVLADFSSDSIV